MDERELVEKSIAGDKEAFGVLVNRYKSREAADDLAQEIFIKAYRALGKFRFRSQFGTWLYRIAVNHAKDHLRKERKIKVIPFNNIQDEARISQARWKDKEGAKEKEHRLELIHRVLRSLPEKQRVVLTLRDIQGHTYEEIADILHLSAGTVDSRLHRARKMLRERLAPLLASEGGRHEM